MVIDIPNVLTAAQVADARAALLAAEWVDGNTTAGHQAARAKNNLQIPPGHPTSRQVGELITRALSANPLFVSAALPLQIMPPMFNRYSGGQQFGTHVDGAIRQIHGTGHRIRTDLSATLFFEEPENYDGGELIIEDTYGSKQVKLAAGHMVLYPATSLHRVMPVTRGERLCAFFWIQSMIRDGGQRSILFDLDLGIQRLGTDRAGHPGIVQLTGVYHNLLRQWAEM